MNSNLSTGSLGESLATTYLIRHGYTIITRNERTKFGEIDIIAKKEQKYFFIEVKTRSSVSKGKPYESVTPVKLKHLFRAVQCYVLKNRLSAYKLSIGVISIQLKNNQCEHLDFFESIDRYS